MLAALLVIGVIAAAIGGGQLGHRQDNRALAAALPHVANGQVCDAGQPAGQALHHAGVVVVFPDGTETYCVEFAEDELSGAELLQRTGLPLVLSGFGGLGSGVCRIDNIGCSDPGNCFCQCQGADCHYWTYFELNGDAWRVLPVGASQRRGHDGDVDGWVWGNGHTPPGAASIGKLCAALRPTAPPTSTPVPANGGGGNNQPVATPTPSSGIPPADGSGGRDQTASRASHIVLTPGSTNAAERTRATAPAPRVVGQSNRPPSDVAGAGRDTATRAAGGPPAGLLAFAGVAGGLIVVGGGFVLRKRLRG